MQFKQLGRVFGSLALIACMSAPAAASQFSDAVKGAMDGKSSTGFGSGSSALGSMGGVPSVGSTGVGNAAGLIGFCMKNNYLGGGAAGVKDKLLSKLGGEKKAQSDPSYSDGLKGILSGKDGQKVDLNNASLKQKVTDKACEQVLKHGKSLI